MSLGDREEEFDQVALVHLDALYRTAHRLTGSPEEAQDLVQETYLRAFRFFHQFKEGTNCRAWLYKILRNTFVNRYEKKKRDLASVDLEDVAPFVGQVDEEIGYSADTYDEMLGRLLDDDVKQALMDLPEPYRIVVILADLESMAYKEIAEVVEIPIGTVMSRLFRGRKALRAQLAEAASRYGLHREMEQ